MCQYFQYPFLRSLCALAGIVIGSQCAATDIAITIDDLPFVLPSQTAPEAGLKQARDVTKALAKHQITATGFVVGSQLKRTSRPALMVFAQAGHTLGNHTWSHPDFDSLTARQFRREVKRTDKALKELPQYQRLFRFPYLREGKTPVHWQTGQNELADLGYQNVPVSIDNDDWKFNADYIAALKEGDHLMAADIANAYIEHMKERSLHFDALATSATGREVAHILLLHLNQINADHLKTLLDWYAAQGWEFVTVNEALNDPIYSMPNLYFGPQGLSQIERILGGAGQ